MLKSFKKLFYPKFDANTEFEIKTTQSLYKKTALDVFYGKNFIFFVSNCCNTIMKIRIFLLLKSSSFSLLGIN